MRTLLTMGFSEGLVKIILLLLPVVEVGLAICLILRIRVKEMLIATSVLFLGVLVFSLVGVVSGVNADCGCFGDLLKSGMNWRMVVRNFVFLLTALFLFLNKNVTDQRKSHT